MTKILRSSRKWPAILLPEAGAGDPLDIDRARDRGSFVGLRRSLHDIGGTGTIAMIAASGLRGRGGAGFPTGDKWRAAAGTLANQRYVVANGYGADPSSATDRTLLERNPYAVIEGALIAAIAIGAADVIVAVRSDATDAIRSLETALERMIAAGLAGDDVLGSGHAIEVAIRPVQGAYMLGEETVLLRALEGKRGQPEQRPPHPAERGLFGKPTVVQNVQTLAAVPWIVANGAEAFAAIGSKGSPGTILVSVRTPSGAGVAEIPMGTKLRDIIALAGPVATGGGKARLNSGPRRHRVRLRRPPGGRRPRRLGRDRRRRPARLRRRPGPPPDPLLRRRGVRQDDPVPDRVAPGERDRRPDRDRRPEADGRRAPGRPVGRYRRVRPVRSRAPGDPPVRERDAILPVRARRAHPAELVPGRRLPTDRGRRWRSPLTRR